MPTLPPFDPRDRAIEGISGTDPMEGLQETDDALSGEQQVTELDDGSAEVVFPDEIGPVVAFQDNLADVFNPSQVKRLGISLVEQVDKDKESRKRRDEQYEEGLRRTGLGEDAPGGADFAGASRVVHPILAESCVDFASRAIKELFPPSGPVKTALDGAETEQRLELANRKAKFLNWQLRKKMREYRSELEQLLTQLPMGGSQYQKFWHDDRLRRARTEFVPIDHVFLPYAATDFYTAQRVTHEQLITAMEFGRRIDSGLYRDVVSLVTPPEIPEQSSTDSANEKIEGKDADAYNDDGLRSVYEIYTWHEFDEDDVTAGALAPYIITVDAYTEEVLAIYRNWEEGDATFEKLDWMVEWKFIPWRGAYAIGFPHLIGGLSGAATGSLRALLDSAHINNSQTLLKLRGGKVSGQNIEVEPTQIADIEGPAGVDDIRKVIMAMPYNPPSPVLFQLLGWLTAAGKGVIATAEEKLENVGDRTPVGTTQALIEQGSHTYSSIHSRLHYSQAKALEIICRINRVFLDEETVVEELGGLVMSRQDFANSNDISPVSDPEIFSESQRYAQNQGIIQLRQIFNGQTLPNLPFNDNAIARRMLRRMRVENVDEILPEPPKPQNLNPAAENVAATLGQPVTSLPQQNHLAHIYAHVEFCMNPVFANPVMGKTLMNTMVAHLAEHIAHYYADLMGQATQFEQLVAQMPTKQLEGRMAQANPQVLMKIQQDLANILPQIQQISQMAQQFTPPPPVDPAVDATYKAAMADIERKKTRDTAEIDLEKQLKLQIHPELERQKRQTDLVRNVQDNKQKHVTELLKNQSDNQTKQWIAALQANQASSMAVYQTKLDQQENEAGRLHEVAMSALQPPADATGDTGGALAAPMENTPNLKEIEMANAETNAKVDQLMQAVSQLVQLMQSPKQVVRDSNGRVVGVQPVIMQKGNNGNIQ